jgi:Flp pilus assembly protein TadB
VHRNETKHNAVYHSARERIAVHRNATKRDVGQQNHRSATPCIAAKSAISAAVSVYAGISAAVKLVAAIMALVLL